jgi:hypothetical protein
MNIDERLEALTMNLELLSHASEALRDSQRQTLEATLEAFEAQRQISQVQDRRIEKLTTSIEKLVEVTNEDATNIRALAGIVQSHERRISDIERTN